MIDLKTVREEKGYTQVRLSEESGVGRTQITNIELGTSKASIESAKAISKVLGFSWTEFFE